MRKGLELFANLRPVKSFAALAGNSTLRPEAIAGVDLMMVRELTGGVYFGHRERTADTAYDTMFYSEAEVERLRGLRLLAWRRAAASWCTRSTRPTCSRARGCGARWPSAWPRKYADVELRHMLVDNCAMQLIRNPRQFDVVATENLFGDILSDEAAMLTGSIGMLPSASVGGRRREPLRTVPRFGPRHRRSGQGQPVRHHPERRMMLDLGFGERAAARAVESAVETALEQGARTADIAAPGEGRWAAPNDRPILAALAAG